MRQIPALLILIECFLLLYAPGLLASSISPYLAEEYDLKLTSKSGIYLSQPNYQPNHIQFNKLHFNLTDHQISAARTDTDHLNRAITQAQSFKLTNWDNEYLPLLNDVPLDINGKSLALSISEDEKHLVLASDKETVLFTSTGKRLWQHIESSRTISTLISVDMKYVISLFSNGVMRWLNYDDGSPVYSLYISVDTRDWIIWTPDGYYDSSSPYFNPLRFNIPTSNNNSLLQLRAQLFRPDIVKTAQLSGTRPTDSILKPLLPPPEVSFENNDDQLVELCIKSSSSPHDAIVAINGVTVSRKAVQPIKTSTEQDCQFYNQVKLPTLQGNNNISISVISQQSSARSRPIIKTVESRHAMTELREFITLMPYSYKSGNLTKLLKNNKTQLPIRDALKEINSTKYISLFLYLSAECKINNNDIELSSHHGQNKISLSELSLLLQNVNIINSLIAIDCTVKSSTVNTLATKRLIYNFIADTGRSTIAQFITRDQLKLSGSKQTIFESVLIDALREGSDIDNAHLINSVELLDYIEQNLPLKNFELTGEQGIFYIYNDRKNNFDIPARK